MSGPHGCQVTASTRCKIEGWMSRQTDGQRQFHSPPFFSFTKGEDNKKCLQHYNGAGVSLAAATGTSILRPWHFNEATTTTSIRACSPSPILKPKSPGPWFNIKMSSYQYRKSHCGDKTVVRLSYLHNGISYTGKMTSLYWFSPLEVFLKVTWPFSIFTPSDLEAKSLGKIPRDFSCWLWRYLGSL